MKNSSKNRFTPPITDYEPFGTCCDVETLSTRMGQSAAGDISPRTSNHLYESGFTATFNATNIDDCGQNEGTSYFF